VHELPRLEWQAALKALAGFAAGVAFWLMASPLYDRAIAAGAQGVMRAFENPKVTRLRPADDNRVTVDRSDFDPRSKRPAISLRDLTFNVVLLIALFAASKRTFSDRNIGGFFAAVAILALTHIGAAVVEVMSIYVAQLGPWSRANYSDLDRNVWGVARHFYRLVLMYAIVFALWWTLHDRAAAAGPSTAAGTAKKKKRR
jgi:hypothetical protein